MARFAQNTRVPIAQTRAEIESLLERYGADGFAYVREGRANTLGFRIANRTVRITLLLPDPWDREFTHTEAQQRERTATAREQAWATACRQRWRALLLIVKAKLEAIANGISTIEDEFLSWIVTDTGQTVGERLLGNLDNVVARGPLHLLENTDD